MLRKGHGREGCGSKEVNKGGMTDRKRIIGREEEGGENEKRKNKKRKEDYWTEKLKEKRGRKARRRR
jgi:hypothetical protein